MHTNPLFGSVDVVLAGIIALAILAAVIVTIPDLARTLKIHSM
jgi:hypothetical protein